MTKRNMVFISHANPEDNEFTRWLALRLAAEGFPIWCDLTELLGGEDFWLDIENALRNRTVKFLYVLSKTSNGKKPGPLDELELARKVQKDSGLSDFIVPLAVDDLFPNNYNIALTRLNAIPFQPGWHSGLVQLVTKLERDDVARHHGFNAAAVATWWRQRVRAGQVVERKPEIVTTNLYPIRPATLYFHRLGVSLENAPIDPSSIDFPAERFGDHIVTFAPAQDVTDKLGSGRRIVDSVGRRIGVRSGREPRHPWSYRQEQTTLSKLLNRAWQDMLVTRDLPTRRFARGAPALYFKAGMIPNDTIRFRRPDGSAGRRQVIGYKTMRRAGGHPWLRYWHFCLGAIPTTQPDWGLVMKSHVLFSEDGVTIWDSISRLSRARRNQCRGWWNDTWRDLTHAAMHFLAGGKDSISLRVGTGTNLEVRAQPVDATSPVSYDERANQESDDAVAIDGIDPDDVEDDDG